MIFVQHYADNPYFNLAMEEYLLREADHESVFLWQSRPSVVIGKHQNALGEVNYPYVTRNSIPVIRRLSGGGTVFHSPGNINFTFVRNGEEGKLVDFRKHTAPVIDFLLSLGIPARFEGKNDIRVKGLKVSGNAEHVFRQRVLHHGTLLYDADLSVLNESIRVTPGRYVDRGVASVRSKVANVSEFMKDPLPLDKFMALFAAWLKDYFSPLSGERELTAGEREKIQVLADEKYAQWGWNFGYSPDYEFRGSIGDLPGELSSKLPSGEMTLVLNVEKGIIRRAGIQFSEMESRGSGPVRGQWEQLAEDLPGCRHAGPDIVALLHRHGLLQRQEKTLPEGLARLFF